MKCFQNVVVLYVWSLSTMIKSFILIVDVHNLSFLLIIAITELEPWDQYVIFWCSRQVEDLNDNKCSGTPLYDVTNASMSCYVLFLFQYKVYKQ